MTQRCTAEPLHTERRLSLTECRRELDGALGMSDAQVLALRDELYTLGTATVEAYVARKRGRGEGA